MSFPSWASVIITLAAATTLAIAGDYLYSKLTRVPFKASGKHCFITGGSTGLGKSLAIQLAKEGADVCIIARRVSELETAAKEIKVNAENSLFFIILTIYCFIVRLFK
jgi:3-dehydrosphinganine reductase